MAVTVAQRTRSARNISVAQRNARRGRTVINLAGYGEPVRSIFRDRERITCDPRGDGCCDLEYRCGKCHKWKPFHNGGTDTQWCDECWVKYIAPNEGK